MDSLELQHVGILEKVCNGVNCYPLNFRFRIVFCSVIGHVNRSTDYLFESKLCWFQVVIYYLYILINSIDRISLDVIDIDLHHLYLNLNIALLTVMRYKTCRIWFG